MSKAKKKAPVRARKMAKAKLKRGGPRGATTAVAAVERRRSDAILDALKQLDADLQHIGNRLATIEGALIPPKAEET